MNELPIFHASVVTTTLAVDFLPFLFVNLAPFLFVNLAPFLPPSLLSTSIPFF
jgi:hypothetical protein